MGVNAKFIDLAKGMTELRQQCRGTSTMTMKWAFATLSFNNSSDDSIHVCHQMVMQLKNKDDNMHSL